MADTEITDLTSASAPDGTESVHVVQGGNSRVLTLANLFKAINGLTAETSPAKEDKLALYDADGASGDAITLANFFKVINDLAAIASASVSDSIVAYDSDGSVAGKLTLQKVLDAINGLTADTAPDLTADYLAAYDSSGSAAKKVLAGRLAPFKPPAGRLTLTSGTPVLTSSVTAATTVYYTPYVGNTVHIYDGTSWIAYTFSELSQDLSDSTKSPAATTGDNNYDLFVWNDSGTVRCTRGPAWSSSTSRGTGASTTEIERVGGVWVNAEAITNGPAAQRGTYVGTIRTNSSNQVDMMVGAPTAAAGGTANVLGVWNMYNRVDVSATSRDSTDSWDYTTATIRAANNSSSNRVTLVRGLDEESVHATYSVPTTQASTGNQRIAGIGLDSTSAFADGSTRGNQVDQTSGPVDHHARVAGLAGLGLHYYQALEYSAGSGTTTWLGDNGDATLYQMALVIQTRM